VIVAETLAGESQSFVRSANQKMFHLYWGGLHKVYIADVRPHARHLIQGFCGEEYKEQKKAEKKDE